MTVETKRTESIEPGTRFRVVSERLGLVWTGDDAVRAEWIALTTAVNTGRTVYLVDGTQP